MEITLEYIQSHKDNWGNIDSLMLQIQTDISIQTKRNAIKDMAERLNFYVQEHIESWVYDDIELDANVIIDKTQELMQQQKLWEQVDGSIIIETPEDWVEINSEANA